MTHDWPGCWEKKEQVLPHVEWDQMRRNHVLMGAIQTSHGKLRQFWDLCEKERVPMEWREDSRAGDPVGDLRDGTFVTATSAKNAYFLHRIRELWLRVPDAPRVLEIGGGFGGLARTISLWLPGTRRYVLVDGPPCLEAQHRYLEMALPDVEWFEYVRHDEILMLFGQEFDLVVNISSFSEMTKEVVAEYFDLIEDVLAPGGALYSLNRDHYQNGRSVNVPAAEFPFDDRWVSVSSPYLGRTWIETLAIRR